MRHDKYNESLIRASHKYQGSVQIEQIIDTLTSRKPLPAGVAFGQLSQAFLLCQRPLYHINLIFYGLHI